MSFIYCVTCQHLLKKAGQEAKCLEVPAGSRVSVQSAHTGGLSAARRNVMGRRREERRGGVESISKRHLRPVLGNPTFGRGLVGDLHGEERERHGDGSP